MMIHDITEMAGRYRNRKRIGRGHGSGAGKTSGRGHKGQGSRSGTSRIFQFEGGQMPYFRRMPKFGFSNSNFKTKFWTANLGEIVAHPEFASGGTVDADALIRTGLIRDRSRDIKILGDLGSGDAASGLGVKLDVTVNRVTGSARRLIEQAGGSVNETSTRRDRVHGVDRNSDDRTPKNLTKKSKRLARSRAKAEANRAGHPG